MTTDDPAHREEGYADGVGWLPFAKPEELETFFGVYEGNDFAEISDWHTLAVYKGWTAREPGDVVGLFARTNGCGVVNTYWAGFMEALREHRPDGYRAARTKALLYRRQDLQERVDQLTGCLAEVDAKLDRLQAKV